MHANRISQKFPPAERFAFGVQQPEKKVEGDSRMLRELEQKEW